jgi:hypothetical protein|tara:strand:+ start:333 stop:1193 length:861 start_codon:yes stop_codon:yes gene_type:complete
MKTKDITVDGKRGRSRNSLVTIDDYLIKKTISSDEPKRIECGVTDNYDTFKDFFGNRSKNLRRAIKISTDMKIHGNFSSVQCIRDGRFLLVWDGQHVLEAAKKSGKHVNYDVYDKVPEDILILKNKHTKQWTLGNFHNHGLAREFPEALKVEQFMQKSKRVLGKRIELTASLRLLANVYSNEAYKCGTFAVAKDNKSNLILGYLKDYSKHIEFSACSKFVTSLFLIVKTGLYDHEVMLKQLEKASRKLHNQLRVQDVVFGIQECYNYGRHSKKVDFLFACGFSSVR